MLENDTWEKYPEVANLADDPDMLKLNISNRKQKVRARLGGDMSDEASKFLRMGAVQIRQKVEDLVADLK